MSEWCQLLHKVGEYMHDARPDPEILDPEILIWQWNNTQI